jgi:hypothetical protein
MVGITICIVIRLQESVVACVLQPWSGSKDPDRYIWRGFSLSSFLLLQAFSSSAHLSSLYEEAEESCNMDNEGRNGGGQPRCPPPFILVVEGEPLDWTSAECNGLDVRHQILPAMSSPATDCIVPKGCKTRAVEAL